MQQLEELLEVDEKKEPQNFSADLKELSKSTNKHESYEIRIWQFVKPILIILA